MKQMRPLLGANLTGGYTMTPTSVAIICHEANRAFCEAHGDRSQLPWVVSPEWQRTSAVNGVLFHMEHPAAGPEASHNNWLEEKRAAGWVYGEIKNPACKTHPCMVPFSELPLEQQAKDVLFKAIVDAMRPLMAGVAPTEDTPTEDTPTEDTPTEDTPTEDTPTEDTVAEEGITV